MDMDGGYDDVGILNHPSLPSEGPTSFISFFWDIHWHKSGG